MLPHTQVLIRNPETFMGQRASEQEWHPLETDSHALAALGPIHELPDYNFVRRRSYWLRY